MPMDRGGARPFWRVRVTTTVVALFTTLSLLGMGTVLAIGLIGAAANTRALVRERTATALTTTLDYYHQLIVPVQEAIDGVVSEIAAGRLDLNNEPALRGYFAGLLDGAPQVTGINLLRPGLRVEGFWQNAALRQAELPTAFVQTALKQADLAPGPWLEPAWSPTLREPVLTLYTPFKVPGGSTGLFLSQVVLDQIFQGVAELSRELPQTIFIIYDRGLVLAHSRPPASGVVPNAAKPVLTLTEYGDPILAQIWEARVVPVPTGGYGRDIEARLLATPGEDYEFIYRIVDSGNGHNFTIGTYYRGSIAKAELQRLDNMGLAGLGTLLLAVGVTIVVGRRFSRPVLALAAAAGEIEKQQFDKFQPVPRTRIRELDQAGQAFNQMVVGLRERLRIRDLFGKYVPNEVVERLLANPGDVALGGERREISLLFTDIAGFTTMSEKLSPETVLDLLNDYFEGVTRCITQRGGIIVDFIGDAVFASFNAPVAYADHARRALACAHEIDRFARLFAAERQALGIPLGQTRIGLHTGTATVGNMGSTDRLKYSAAGDVVNTASRLEGANKLFDTRILASGEAIRQAGETQCRPVGGLVLKGRTEPLEVFELLSEAEAAGGWLESYRHAFNAIEQNPEEAHAGLLALAEVRPDDGVIRFYLDRLQRGVNSVVIELTEK